MRRRTTSWRTTQPWEIFYSRVGNTNAALTNYEAALTEEPNYADAHNNIGSIFLDSQRYDEAIQHYRAAVHIQPGYLGNFNLANALADAASARHDAAQFAEAVAIYREALQLNPNSSEAHHNLADVPGRKQQHPCNSRIHRSRAPGSKAY